MLELISEVKNGNLEKVKKLIEEEGADINAREDNLTILHIASRYGHKDIVDYLIKDKNFDYENIYPPIGPMTLSGVHIGEIVGDVVKKAAADVLLMRGMAQRYAEDGAVKRSVDIPQMLELFITSIDYIERSQKDIKFIAQNPYKPEINKKEFFQKEVLTWIAVCAKSMMEKYKKNIVFETLSDIGKYTDLVHARRGQQYNKKILDTADQGIISAALPDIFEELCKIKNYLKKLNDENHISSIPDISSIQALVHYYSDINHLEKIKVYTETIVNPSFNLDSRINKEALLRSLEALGEAKVHLSEETGKAVFWGVDIDSLSKIRHKLDHINDRQKRGASSKESRAERLEKLLEGDSKVVLKLLEEVVKQDIPLIHHQTLKILQCHQATIVRPNYNQDMHSLIIGEDQTAEKDRCHKNWSNVKNLKKGLTKILSTSSKIPSYLKDFDVFLSFERFLKQSPESILGKLKAIETSDNKEWEAEAKKILFNNKKSPKNIESFRVMIQIDDNMYYLISTIKQINFAKNLVSDISKELTSSKLELEDICIKSIEFNLINFNEHVDCLCKKQEIKKSYTEIHHNDISAEFKQYIEKARNYFAHIGNNRFHDGTQPIDHGLIIKDIVPKAIQIHKNLVDIHNDFQNKALELLQTLPNWDHIELCKPILTDNLISNDENLPELLNLARIRYGDEDGIKQLNKIGLDNNKYTNFQNLRDGFGSDVALKLIVSKTKVNINLALIGGGLMKFMEVWPDLKYLLTEYFPVLPVIDQYFNFTIINFLSENETLVSTGLHLLGGILFTYSLSGEKWLIPVAFSLVYGSKQYLLNNCDILFTLNDQKTSSYLHEGTKFTLYVVTGLMHSVLISTPFLEIAGFPLTGFYPVTQGALIGMHNYYNNFNQKQHQHQESSVDYVAAFATTSAYVLFISYKIMHLPTMSEKIIATASAVQTLANIHCVSRLVYNFATDTVSHINDFIYREDEDRDINLELVGEL